MSYALAGAVAVPTYRIAVPWRPAYLAVVLLVYTLPLAAAPTFTDVGHFSAVLVGLACRLLTRGRGKTRNPKETVPSTSG